ncbi:MAG: ABC transporter permease [Kiritimatiellae bacterium]|nr:ABC transporter permease [Kiritimatiellia bacterium]MDD5521686.1 ABC transporter permease [Kiritimatiellia bacterium]
MINVRDLLRIGTRQVFRHRNRYYGGILAIALGTCGFIVVMTMGRDIKMNINRDLDLLGGATMVKVTFRRDMPSCVKSFFKQDTVDAISRLPGVNIVSLSAMKNLYASTFLREKEFGFVLVGVDDAFWTASSFTPKSGRFFSIEDVTERRKVCVLGSVLANRIFGNLPALGQSILIDCDYYEIIGFLEGTGVGDMNQFAFLPITTAVDRIDCMTPKNKLYVRCRTWDDVESVASLIPGTVRQFQSDNGLQVDVARAQLKYIKKIAWWIQLFVFVSISATLCLGATGIWYGMMTAVRSRTREIGLKKAMGATNHDIMAQFLTESLCLSIGSTVIGTGLGWLIMNIIGALIHSSPVHGLFIASVMTSITISVILGVAAGYYPSAQAARLEVISAVRFE